MTVCVIFGIVLAAAIPAYLSFANSNALGNAAAALGSDVQLMRAKAMSDKVNVNLDLTSTPAGITYNLAGGGLLHSRSMPHGIVLAPGSDSTLSILKTGRAATSRLFVLKDRRGNRDTVSVQLSGVVLVL